MYIDKILKKEVLILIISVISVLILLGSVSYSYFFVINKGKSNIINVGDLEISFCTDESCNKKIPNFGQVIGTKNVNNTSVAEQIHPFIDDSEALKKMPYIFNIKNTGSLNTLLTIKLHEDKDYSYKGYESVTVNYKDNIRIGISNCNDGVNTTDVDILKYSDSTDGMILRKEVLESKKDNTYCLWTWLDKDTPNSVMNTYFVANLDFKAEYIPN